MKSRTARLATTLAAAAMLVLSGCSDGSEAPASAPSGSDTPAESTADEEMGAPGLPKGVQGVTNVPDDVPNDPGARANVVVSSCESAGGGWRASGTATNPGKERVTYTVTVFFTTTSATVIGTGKTLVEVAPGAEETWHVDDAFKAPDSTLCVLRGVA